MVESDAKPEDIVSRLNPDTDTTPEEIVPKLGITSDIAESELAWLANLQKESSKTLTLEEQENEGILGIRNWWAYCVLFLIVLIVVFDMLLVWFLGSGIWQFTNPSIVIAVITDNFLKIVGLGFLITREIFKKIYH